MTIHDSNTPKEHKDTWRTPPEVFSHLDAEFNFKMDACASAENALVSTFISEDENTLTTPWLDKVSKGDYVFMNPPYSDPMPFISKCHHESRENGIGSVVLLPASTDTGWFNFIMACADEVRFVTKGRLSFISSLTGKAVKNNPKGSMIAVWYPSLHQRVCQVTTITKSELMGNN